MTALTIRDVSEDAVRTMKTRAAQAGQSLQAYLRSLIEREAARPTLAEAVEQARRQATADIGTTDILAAIDGAFTPTCPPTTLSMSPWPKPSTPP
jgi:antitoxin FitA